MEKRRTSKGTLRFCTCASRLHCRGYISGLEEALVRPEICAPSLLQELGRIPAAPALRPRGYPHMHTGHSQEARQYVLHRLAQTNVLSSSRVSEGSSRMGQGRQRGKGGSTADKHGHRRHGGCVIDRPDTRSTETWAGQPIPIPLTTRTRDHVVGL